MVRWPRSRKTAPAVEVAPVPPSLASETPADVAPPVAEDEIVLEPDPAPEPERVPEPAVDVTPTAGVVTPHPEDAIPRRWYRA